MLLIRTLDKFGDLEIMAPACYQIANNTLINDVIFLVKKKREKQSEYFLKSYFLIEVATKDKDIFFLRWQPNFLIERTEGSRKLK